MGIISKDSMELDNGVILQSQYINVFEMNVRKMKEGEYLVYTIFHFYASKEAKLGGKEHIKKDFCTVGATSLEDLHGQAYAQFKKKFENVEDDL
jgi:hypothetical protein